MDQEHLPSRFGHLLNRISDYQVLRSLVIFSFKQLTSPTFGDSSEATVLHQIWCLCGIGKNRKGCRSVEIPLNLFHQVQQQHLRATEQWRRDVSVHYSYSGFGPVTIAVADFNGDGNLDLAVAGGGFSAGSVSILLGKGDGTFQPVMSFAAGLNPSSLAAADFNGDGTPDLAIANLGSVNSRPLLARCRCSWALVMGVSKHLHRSKLGKVPTVSY
jgi:hypothetical protein